LDAESNLYGASSQSHPAAPRHLISSAQAAELAGATTGLARVIPVPTCNVYAPALATSCELEFNNVKDKYYQNKTFPSFELKLHCDNRLMETRVWYVKLRLKNGNNNYDDDNLAIRNRNKTKHVKIDTGGIAVELDNHGSAEVTNLVFKAISSKAGGYFVLEGTVGYLEGESFKDCSYNFLSQRRRRRSWASSRIEILSERLFYSQIDKLRPDDDVIKLGGIGPEYSKRLREKGYGTIRKLAKLADPSSSAKKPKLSIRKKKGQMTDKTFNKLVLRAADICNSHDHPSTTLAISEQNHPPPGSPLGTEASTPSYGDTFASTPSSVAMPGAPSVGKAHYEACAQKTSNDNDSNANRCPVIGDGSDRPGPMAKCLRQQPPPSPSWSTYAQQSDHHMVTNHYQGLDLALQIEGFPYGKAFKDTPLDPFDVVLTGHGQEHPAPFDINVIMHAQRATGERLEGIIYPEHAVVTIPRGKLRATVNGLQFHQLSGDHGGSFVICVEAIGDDIGVIPAQTEAFRVLCKRQRCEKVDDDCITLDTPMRKVVDFGGTICSRLIDEGIVSVSHFINYKRSIEALHATVTRKGSKMTLERFKGRQNTLRQLCAETVVCGQASDYNTTTVNACEVMTNDIRHEAAADVDRLVLPATPPRQTNNRGSVSSLSMVSSSTFSSPLDLCSEIPLENLDMWAYQQFQLVSDDHESQGDCADFEFTSFFGEE